MANTPSILYLDSQLDLGRLDGYQSNRHHSIIHLLTDDQGKLHIMTNANLTGTLAIDLGDQLSVSSDINFEGDVIEANLFADCQISLDVNFVKTIPRSPQKNYENFWN